MLPNDHPNRTIVAIQQGLQDFPPQLGVRGKVAHAVMERICFNFLLAEKIFIVLIWSTNIS
jgi:hypothetical protein